MLIICNFIGVFDFRFFFNDYISINWFIDCFKKVVLYSKFVIKYVKLIDLKCFFSFFLEEL